MSKRQLVFTQEAGSEFIKALKTDPADLTLDSFTYAEYMFKALLYTDSSV